MKLLEVKLFDEIKPKQLITTPYWPKVFELGTQVTNEFFSNWQLGFGTLLGAVRDGTIIKHDIDLDIDVLLEDEEDKIELFLKKMIDVGFKPLKSQRFKYNNKNLYMSMAYKYNEVIFDVCFFRKFCSDYLHVGSEGLVIRPGWSFEKKELLLASIKCYIPVLYNDYLKGRYGDWKTPTREKGDWNDDAVKGDLFIPLDIKL